MSKELDSRLNKLQKKYGPGVIMDLRKIDSIPQIERVPVPSPKIGDLLGFGGMARGRIVEIYGAESSGKTSLATYFAGVFQNHTFADRNNRKGIILFIDAEHAFDVEFAKIHNFDMNQCILVQPDYGEQGLDVAINLIESGEVDMVIIDSIAALTPQAEIEADMDEQQMGLQARMLSKFFRKASAFISQSKTTLVCINQTRQKIGAYGNPITTPGGEALKFYSSIRIETRRKEYMTVKDETTGIVIQLRCVKNKTAPPNKKYLVDMSFDKGFDAHLEWIDFAIEHEIIENPAQGSYVLLSGERVRGKQKVVEYYSDPANNEEYEKVIEATKERIYTIKGAYRVSVDEEYTPEEDEE